MKRVRQFWRALRPLFSEGDLALLDRYLDEAGRCLFMGMPPAFRRHALNVAHTLLAQDPEAEGLLIQAALLHDSGKQAARIRLWHRVLFTLWPALGDVPPEPALAGWRRPFQVARHHPYYGAKLAEEMGLAPELVDLVRSHHLRPAPNALIERLQWADELN